MSDMKRALLIALPPSLAWTPPSVSWCNPSATKGFHGRLTHIRQSRSQPSPVKRSHVRILWYFHLMSPELRGLPIEIAFLPVLRVHRGKLLSGNTVAGREVHAGSFLRQRRVVLDAALKKHPAELDRILTHELFHFAWLRLGNPKRRSYEDLLKREYKTGVEGELGWSAECAKAAITRADSTGRTRRWRDYVCESFCDSGAWLFASPGRHEEFTLPSSACRARRRWFEQARLTHVISL